jgi:hypothetical protein
MLLLNLFNPRRGFLALVILLLALLGACAEVASQPPTAAAPPTATSNFVITPAPGIAATVTAALKLPPLSSAQAAPYLEIQEMVQACQEFHNNRRLTILTHMQWLTHPSEVPPELINLYGDNVPGQLVFGAAYTVATEWKSGGRLPASCLVPIGDRLNVILVELGRKPVAEFAVP